MGFLKRTVAFRKEEGGLSKIMPNGAQRIERGGLNATTSKVGPETSREHYLDSQSSYSS